MPDYQKGKIYKVWENSYTKCYIGSTCENLSQRMSSHRSGYKRWNETGREIYKNSVYELFDEYGVENCKIELLEIYPCQCKEELRAREGVHQKQNDCINKHLAGRTKKGYYEDNRERMFDICKKYKEDNKDYYITYKKNWYVNNKDKINEDRKTEVVCECGCVLQKSTISRHKKTSKHQNYINQMNQQEQTNSS